MTNFVADPLRSGIITSYAPSPSNLTGISSYAGPLSGKRLEVPVKRILMGTPAREAASLESLSNPDALAYFVELARELGAQPAGSAT